MTVLHIGTNNAATDIAQNILSNLAPLNEDIKEKLPKTKVNISSLVKKTQNTEVSKAIQKVKN